MRLLTLSITTILLSSCAYILDSSMQEIEVKTPGARNAICYAYVDDVRYRIYPPQKITITKSEKDLEVDCLAPGNRRNKVIIEPVISDAGKMNLATGGVTAAWDYAAKTLFEYPNIIYVDFTHTPVKAMPYPAQNQPDIRQPEDYPLEQFSPGKPRLNKDTHTPAEIRVRDGGSSQTLEEGFVADYQTFFGSEKENGGKGDLKYPATNPLD